MFTTLDRDRAVILYTVTQHDGYGQQQSVIRVIYMRSYEVTLGHRSVEDTEGSRSKESVETKLVDLRMWRLTSYISILTTAYHGIISMLIQPPDTGTKQYR